MLIQFYSGVIKQFFGWPFVIFFILYRSSFSSLNISSQVILLCLAISSQPFTTFAHLTAPPQPLMSSIAALVSDLVMTIAFLI
jgi:hypothetical protein